MVTVLSSRIFRSYIQAITYLQTKLGGKTLAIGSLLFIIFTTSKHNDHVKISDIVFFLRVIPLNIRFMVPCSPKVGLFFFFMIFWRDVFLRIVPFLRAGKFICNGSHNKIPWNNGK